MTGRVFSDFANADPKAVELLELLARPEKEVPAEQYRFVMTDVGKHLGDALFKMGPLKARKFA